MSTLRPREKVKQRNSQNHHFPMKNLHFWKTTRRPQVASCLMWPQPGVVSFTTESDATDSDFPSGDPHAGPLGSADSEGLRPHGQTLEKASQANFFLVRKSNVIRFRTQTHITNFTILSPHPPLQFRPKSGCPCFPRMVSEA